MSPRPLFCLLDDGLVSVQRQSLRKTMRLCNGLSPVINSESDDDFCVTVTKRPHHAPAAFLRARQNPAHPTPRQPAKRLAPQHTGLHLSSKPATQHMHPDETPTVVVGNLSDFEL